MFWQCSFSSVTKIQQIGWERKPHRENLYLSPPKIKQQEMTIFWLQISGHITKAFLLIEYIKNNAKKLYCPLFVQNVHIICWSRLSMISNSIICRNGIHHSFTYHVLWKDHLIFFKILPIRHDIFPTPYQ